jgi:hypothetical protein
VIARERLIGTMVKESLEGGSWSTLLTEYRKRGRLSARRCEGFGEVFPTLPADLLRSGPVRPTPIGRRPEASVSAFAVASTRQQRKAYETGSGRGDLNPRRRAPKARALPGCATPRGVGALGS